MGGPAEPAGSRTAAGSDLPSLRDSRDADAAEVEERRAAAAARAEQPEAVPDIVVALPVVIFRSFARVWLRSGFFFLALPLLLAFGGVTDLVTLLFTGGSAPA